MAKAGQLALQRRGVVLRLAGDRILRNSAIYLGGSLAAGLLGYVFHFATGRLLGPAQYAIVASLLASLYIVTLPSLVVQTVSVRYVSLAIGSGQSGSIPRLLLRISAISLAIGSVAALALVLLAPFVAGYLQISSPQLVYVLALASLIALLVTANRGALQGARRFWALSGNTVLDMAVRVVAAVLLIGVGLGVAGGILALLAGPLIAYAQSLLLLRQRGLPSPSSLPSLSEVGRYALTATVAAAGVTYLFNADVILAKHYLSPQQAGIYAAGSVLARVVYFLGLTVAAVMFPEVSTLHAKDHRHFHVVDRSLLLLALIAVALVLTYLLVPGLVLLPYGHSFDSVRPYLAPFAAALSLLALANLLVNYSLSIGSSRFVLPLVGSCVLETALIVAFHEGVGQIVAMLFTTLAVLASVLGAVYLWDRVRAPGATS